MVNWVCPSCEGAFPRPASTDRGDACPWCGSVMEMNPKDPEEVPIVSRVSRDDEDRGASGLFEVFR